MKKKNNIKYHKPTRQTCVIRLLVCIVFILIALVLFFITSSASSSTASSLADSSSNTNATTNTTTAIATIGPPLPTSSIVLRDDNNTKIHNNMSDCALPNPVATVPVTYCNEYKQVGVLTNSKNAESHNLILPLYGRPHHRRSSNKWQYYAISNTGMVNTKLPITNNGKSCTNEYGCDELVNGDVVVVKGYNDSFEVTMYENNIYSYNPFL